jgi:hypothetical protein
MACLLCVRNGSSKFNIIHEMKLVFLVLILRFTVYYFCWCESRIEFRRFAEISGDFIAGGINVAGNTHPIRSTWSHFRCYVRAHDVGELALWYLFTCLFSISASYVYFIIISDFDTPRSLSNKNDVYCLTN